MQALQSSLCILQKVQPAQKAVHFWNLITKLVSSGLMPKATDSDALEMCSRLLVKHSGKKDLKLLSRFLTFPVPS